MNQLKVLQRSVVLRKQLRFLSAQSLAQSEYTDKPEYPPIEDLSFKVQHQKKKQSWYDKIQNLQTIEEKQIELNMPRYYGYKCHMLNEQKTPYNCLPMIQHRTETVFEEVDNLPEFYNLDEKILSSFIELLKGNIEDSIKFQYNDLK